MKMVAVCVVGAGLLLTAWLAKYRKVQVSNLEELLSRVEMGWSIELYPYISPDNEDSPEFSDDELWKHMGIRGAWAIFKNAGLLVTILSVAARKYPQMAEAYEKSWWLSLWLRKKAMSCILGAGLHLIFRRMPRYTARECIAVYCDLCATVEAVVNVCNPNIKQQVSIIF
jgi:hypothetical protein